MKLLLYIYKCQKCNHEFKVPQLRGAPYGEFLLRSSKGEISYLYALDDEVFNNCHQILKVNSKLCGKKDLEIANILHKIFGYICDQAPSGNNYHIGKPICPNCGGNKMSYWGPTNPAEIIEEDVPRLTYESWNKLNRNDKIAFFNKLLDEHMG